MGLANRLEQAIVMRDEEVVVGDWGVDPNVAATAAKLVRLTWDASAPTVQLQYATLGEYDEAMLLYTSPLNGDVLTLVSHSHVTVSNLRLIAGELSAALDDNGGDGDEPGEHGRDQIKHSGVDNMNGVYAIAWRPVESMPQAMRQIISESVRRLARAKGCYLSFLGVASDHVHLVLHCPPRRNGSWAAYAFKNGIEADIAHRYGTSATLWRKGFLANPSAEPIGGEELLAYLSY